MLGSLTQQQWDNMELSPWYNILSFLGYLQIAWFKCKAAYSSMGSLYGQMPLCICELGWQKMGNQTNLISLYFVVTSNSA